MRLARALLAAAFAGLVALRIASTPAWPDDWDGVGFVLSIAKFDMDRFAPHAPGYPVYVAMLKLVAHVFTDPIQAAKAVAIASGCAATALAWAAARRVWGEDRAMWIAIAVAITPLAWRASTAIGSEAPALMFAALVVYGLAREGTSAALAIGFGVGLGLGTRLSWGPLFLGLFAIAPVRIRLRAFGVAIASTLAWLVPLVAIVGASHLASLLTTHAEGHWSRWGGTVLRDPGAMRIVYFARDVVVDGLGAGTDGLGLAIGAVSAGLAISGLGEWRARGTTHARAVTIALLPYATWIALGQNLREQPRHALPLVVALAVALALAATSVTRTRVLGVLFFAVVSLRTFETASARATTPPPAAQLVDRVRALPDAPRVAVFGGSSARMFELTELSPRAQTAGSLGDALNAIGRMRELPSRVLVTSELEGIATTTYPLVPFATLCRPPRIERRASCLRVFEWRLPFLPPRSP